MSAVRAPGFTVAAAIDFGSHQSGFAWAPLTEQEGRPILSELRWHETRSEQSPVSQPKTLSAVLFADGEIVEWGDQAVRNWTQHRDRGMDTVLRRGFKMDLARACGLVRNGLGDTDLTFDEIKPLVVGYLRWLYDAALAQITADSHDPHAIRWCLTVPALWREDERQLMLDWAAEAGIPRSPEQLLLAVEPEAAALHALAENDYLNLPGQRLLAVDAGGGTVDIATLEVQEDGLAQVGTPLSDGCGSNYLNRMFIQQIVSPIDHERIHDLAEQHSHFLFDLSASFERAKRQFDPDNPDPVVVEIPPHILRLLPPEVRHALAERQNGVDSVILIAPATMREIFDNTVDDILKLVGEQLSEIGDKNLTVMLAGGFGASEYLRKRLGDHLADQVPLLPLRQPDLAVLRGAIRFAGDPSLIRRRQARTTYGCMRFAPFDPEFDPPEKKVSFAFREPLCRDRFEPLVHAGDTVAYNETATFVLTPGLWRQRTVHIRLYAIDSPRAPRYVDAEGCRHVATLVVRLPWHIYARATGWRRIKVTLSFGAAHIIATATILATNYETSIPVEFEHSW